MMRKICCDKCGPQFVLYPEDKANGFLSRVTVLKVGPVPIGHGIQVYNGKQLVEEQILTEVRCDLCNQEVNRGKRVGPSRYGT